MINCPNCGLPSIMMSYNIEFATYEEPRFTTVVLCRNCGEQELHGLSDRDLLLETLEMSKGASTPPQFHNPVRESEGYTNRIYEPMLSRTLYEPTGVDFGACGSPYPPYQKHDCVFCGRDVRSASGIVTAEGIALCLRCRNDDSRKEEVDAILH